MTLTTHLSFGGQCKEALDFYGRCLGQYQKPQGFQVLLGIEDPVEGERLFSAVAQNGTVQMPFQRTFWARGHDPKLPQENARVQGITANE